MNSLASELIRLRILSRGRPKYPSPPRTLVVSYPKCGRTWLRIMIIALANSAAGVLPESDPLDLTSTDRALGVETGIRFTHDVAPHLRPPKRIRPITDFYNQESTIILIRNPLDALVSEYYEAIYRQRYYSGSLDLFLRKSWGGIDSFIKFYNQWWDGLEEKSQPSLLLRYEDMHDNTTLAMKTVASFSQFSYSPADIEASVAAGSFQKMREMEDGSDRGTGRLGRPARGGDDSALRRRRPYGEARAALVPLLVLRRAPA